MGREKGCIPWNKGKKTGQKVWNKGKKGVQKVSEETREKLRGRVPWNKGKHHTAIRGDKNHFWKGGISKTNRDERHQITNTLEYTLFRRGVFERDNFACQKCLVSGGYIEAHHINNFADFPEYRTDVNNGITLCKICHRKYHSIYGNKNNTKEQMKEFLKINQH